MAANSTVVFADLTGSTGVFEALGNAKATQAITRLTQWISQVCEAHHGRVVKTLGDGVLAVFPQESDAVNAVVELQRNHLKRILNWPPKLRMRLQVGVACGEIVEVDGDCYGDAVNVASRLSDLSGADQIWATDSVVDRIANPPDGVRFRSLGPISIRGKAEKRVVYRIEWHEEVVSELLTAPGSLDLLKAQRPDAVLGQIELSWLDVNAKFQSSDLPIHLGRVVADEFLEQTVLGRSVFDQRGLYRTVDRQVIPAWHARQIGVDLGRQIGLRPQEGHHRRWPRLKIAPMGVGFGTMTQQHEATRPAFVVGPVL